MFKPHLDQLGGAQGPSSQGGPQRHLATISCGNRRHHRRVHRASDSCSSSFLLTDPTYLCIFQTQKKNIFFLIIFYSRAHFCKENTFKSLNQSYRYLQTADSLLVKKKLSVETWSQKLNRTAGLGLRIRQRMLTNCHFWYF